MIYHEMPENIRNGGRKGAVVSYLKWPRQGRNERKGGATVKIEEVKGKRGTTVSCHEMPENGRNVGVGGVACSCRELP